MYVYMYFYRTTRDRSKHSTVLPSIKSRKHYFETVRF